MNYIRSNKLTSLEKKQKSQAAGRIVKRMIKEAMKEVGKGSRGDVTILPINLSSYNVNEALKAEIETIGEPVKNDSDVGPYVKLRQLLATFTYTTVSTYVEETVNASIDKSDEVAVQGGSRAGTSNQRESGKGKGIKLEGEAMETTKGTFSNHFKVVRG
ncbi:hypothetical protein Tco_0628403 [Tanacetum coccineum]|uniref:Uncharacterized protein n=1 Tax=Tanacetum coccineum TaxID=301880 RepID=A0ABQ4WQ83_9ASTR